MPIGAQVTPVTGAELAAELAERRIVDHAGVQPSPQVAQPGVITTGFSTFSAVESVARNLSPRSTPLERPVDASGAMSTSTAKLTKYRPAPSRESVTMSSLAVRRPARAGDGTLRQPMAVARVVVPDIPAGLHVHTEVDGMLAGYKLAPAG